MFAILLFLGMYVSTCICVYVILMCVYICICMYVIPRHMLMNIQWWIFIITFTCIMVVFFFSITEPHVQVPDTKCTASDFAVSFVHTHTHTHRHIYIYIYTLCYKKDNSYTSESEKNDTRKRQKCLTQINVWLRSMSDQINVWLRSLAYAMYCTRDAAKKSCLHGRSFYSVWSRDRTPI